MVCQCETCGTVFYQHWSPPHHSCLTQKSLRQKQAEEKEWALSFIDRKDWMLLTGYERRKEMLRLGRIMAEHDLDSDSQVVSVEAILAWKQMKNDWDRHSPLAKEIWMAMDEISDDAEAHGHIVDDSQAAEEYGISRIAQLIWMYFDKGQYK